MNSTSPHSFRSTTKMTATSKTSSLVIRSAVIAALGGLLFGFDTAVISGTVDALKSQFSLDDWWLGFTVGIALIGTILGAATAQYPANSLGRKPTLVVLAVFYFVSALGSAFPWDWASFLFFRFLGGIAVGGASVVSPLYTAEIAPAKTRGVLVAVTQFNIVLGILLAFFSNFVIAGAASNDVAWRWMFGVEAIPAAAFFVLLFIVPESPRWLIGRGRVAEATNILKKLGTDSENVDEEVRIIQDAIRDESQGERERFFCYRFRFPIFLAICMAAFNQLSGINAILYYAPQVFKMAGASPSMAMFFPVIIGLTNLIFTMAAMVVIDHFGRRRLMLVGSFGYILSLGVVGMVFAKYGAGFADGTAPPATVFVVLGALMVFIASHAFGQGACIWVFIGEIFPNTIRAQGQALGSFVHWVLAAVISMLFPPLLAMLGPATIFFGFAGMMVLQLVWVLRIMPETKQIPLEEMQKRLGIA
ncbi:MAG: sugar porter family MFS transporter [Thermoguttaceae bacterium]